MNEGLPKLTEAGFSLLSLLIKGHGQGKRVTLNPYQDNKYEIEGFPTAASTVNRLVAIGYLANAYPELKRAMHYDLTEQATRLTCPKCRGSGMVSRAEAFDGEQGCPQCSRWGILAPGTDYTAPFEIKPKKPRKPKVRAPIVFDPSPTRDGVYWLGLDDQDSWVKGSPFLVKIKTEKATHGSVIHLSFLTGGFDDDALDGTLAQLKHGTIRRFSWSGSFGGLLRSSSAEAYRMHWLGEVYAPLLPESINPAESCKL